jgi:N-acyl-L-homoserine lactone synthetase
VTSHGPPGAADALDLLAATVAGRSDLAFAVATTDAERATCLALRRRAVHEGGWGDAGDEGEWDPFDAAAVHLLGSRRGQPCCCGRLVLPPGPLPTEAACGITVEPAGAVVDVGRMTVVAAVRRADRAVFVALLAALYLETRRRGYTTGCGMMAPSVRSLVRHLGVQLDVLGPDRAYRGALRAPVRFDVAAHAAGVIERWK